MSGRSLLLLALLLSGCVQLAKPAPQPRDYRLDYASPTLTGERLPAVLRVAPVRVAALYDREAMVYSENRYAMGAYPYDRWSTPPGQMVGDLLARDFAASELYRAVQQGPSVLVADYQLEALIESIEEESSGGTCHAVLTLRVQLDRLRVAAGDPVVLRHTYRQEENVACNHPAALAAALSQALQHISQELQTDAYDAVRQDRQD